MIQRHQPAPSELAEIDARILWVLENPAMSDWLKEALRSAVSEDPVALANDLEILHHLVLQKTGILAREALTARGPA